MKTFNIICGGVAAPRNLPEGETVRLDVQGSNKNVELKIEAISKATMGNIPSALLDLLEIGAYVYCADQQIRRGGEELANYGERWRRGMNFIIPVRDPDLWNGSELHSALQETLGFLAGETYQFQFVGAKKPLAEKQLYFEFSDNAMQPDEVALFSGGVDSFAGAVEGIVGQNKKMALVGHHSANQVKSTQSALVDALSAKGHKDKIQYISIEVRNSGAEATEYTQRTRSFLFACLAAGMAHMFGKDRFSFYENGIVSLNLPLTKDILESRATRTTHPRVINGFKRIFSLALGKDIEIDHPYQWLTKKEVTLKIQEHGCTDLLASTNSCTRSRRGKEKTHCGVCSQCIDRRFAILAAGLGDNDDPQKYKVDLLIGDRSMDQEIVMAASYVKFAQNFSHLSQAQFISEHPQITSALPEFEGMTTEQAEEKIFQMFGRHAADVLEVLKQGFTQYQDRLLAGTLPSGCLMAVSFNRNKVEAAPESGYDASLKEQIDKLQARRCEFYVDGQNSRLIFKGGYEVTGANYDVVAVLIDNFRLGKKNGDDIPYVRTSDLALALSIEEASLRRRMTRLREEVSERLAIDQGMVFGTDDFIQTCQRQGYRINKQLKEVMSASDLED